MPFPSGGCQTCKIRRIKCDETKPVCTRCIRSKRICMDTSAAKDACFSIHLENRYVSGQIKRPRGPRSSLTLLRPHLDLQTRAVAYYQHYHLQTLTDVPNVWGGLSECVADWNTSSKFSQSAQFTQMVQLGISSMSLAVFSRTQNHPPADQEASSKYYQLLRVAQERIMQLDEQNLEACLLTAYLMGRYEGATHDPNAPFPTLESWSHNDGAMAILKFWYENLSHKTASPIVKYTRRRLIKTSLLRNGPLPDWMLDGSRFGEEGLELDHDRILVRIVNLHSASLREKIINIEEMNNEAMELDTAMQAWAAQFRSTCSYRRHILSEKKQWSGKHFYSPVVYSYAKLGHAAVWSQYFALRMLILNTNLRILERGGIDSLDHTYEQQRQDCIIELRKEADSLIATIPFILERFEVDQTTSSITIAKDQDIKPHLIVFSVWPLTCASSIKRLDDRQLSWFRSEIVQLGRLIGEGVLACSDTENLALLGRGL